jgi:formamidopyrimidine-DNA glycosylase
MRLRACKEAGLEEVWIEKVENFTEEQKKEFIVKDNVGFGKWDWDVLANKWDNTLLNNWGMDVWDEDINLDNFFEEQDEQIETYKITLEYTEEEYNLMIDKLNKLDGTKEDIIYNSLMK